MHHAGLLGPEETTRATRMPNYQMRLRQIAKRKCAKLPNDYCCTLGVNYAKLMTTGGVNGHEQVPAQASRQAN